MTDCWHLACALVLVVCFKLLTVSAEKNCEGCEVTRCDFAKGNYGPDLVPDINWPLEMRKGDKTLEITVPASWETDKRLNPRISYVCIKTENAQMATETAHITISRTHKSAKIYLRLYEEASQSRTVYVQLFDTVYIHDI